MWSGSKIHPVSPDGEDEDEKNDEILSFLKVKFMSFCGEDNVINKQEFVEAFGLKDVSS